MQGKLQKQHLVLLVHYDYDSNMNDLEYNRRHPQKDIPDEVWMKNLLKAYRKEHEELGYLRSYATGLEEENVMLKKQLDERKPLTDLIEENKNLKNILKSKERLINETYPKKLRRTKYLRSLNQNYHNYIITLQEILNSHGIEYPERPILKDHPLEGVDLDELVKRAEKATEFNNCQ